MLELTPIPPKYIAAYYWWTHSPQGVGVLAPLSCDGNDHLTFEGRGG